MEFEWDEGKAASNLQKHDVGSAEASSVLSDWLSVTIPDPAHSEGEERSATLGTSSSGRLLVVIHTERGDKVRVISARPASARERREYEQGDEPGT